MAMARERMDVVPKLPSWHADENKVAAVLDPVLRAGFDINSTKSRQLVRDCINFLYVSESQTLHAARCVFQMLDNTCMLLESDRFSQSSVGKASLLACTWASYEIWNINCCSSMHDADPYWINQARPFPPG